MSIVTNTVSLIRTTIPSPSVRSQSAYCGPCRVLGSHVTRVTRDGVVRVLCEHCDDQGVCGLRRAALERHSAHGLPSGTPSENATQDEARCVMLTA